MKVIVTGAYGTLGSTLCETLIERGHQLTTFDVPSSRAAGRARRLKLEEAVWGDIRDRDQVDRAVSGNDAVVHCAAVLAPLSEEDPGLSRSINVNGTAGVIASAKRHGARLVYPSSVTVYGPGRRDGPLRQVGDDLCPVDNYSSHKVECETMVGRSDLMWSILRLGVSIDPGGGQVSRAALRAMFEISPETRMEYVHPGDVALAVANLLERDEAWGRILHIGGGPECRIRQRDLFDAVFSAAGIGTLPEEAFDDGHYYTDWMETDASQELLDYQRHTFADFRDESRRAMRWKRPLVRVLRPLVRRYILSHSPKYGIKK